jgi:TIR domain
MDDQQNPAVTIFVSYSHLDKLLVDPIVRLLQAVPGGSVFQDCISIPPGQKWRPIIMAALLEARRVLVFWCAHANSSAEVAREYTDAIERGKAVVPVLLDSTPLPPALGEFEWVDLRELAAGLHKHVEIGVGGLAGALVGGLVGRLIFPYNLHAIMCEILQKENETAISAMASKLRDYLIIRCKPSRNEGLESDA